MTQTQSLRERVADLVSGCIVEKEIGHDPDSGETQFGMEFLEAKTVEVVCNLVHSERAAAWAECREAAAKECESHMDFGPISNIWSPRAAADHTARDIALRIRALEPSHE